MHRHVLQHSWMPCLPHSLAPWRDADTAEAAHRAVNQHRCTCDAQSRLQPPSAPSRSPTGMHVDERNTAQMPRLHHAAPWSRTPVPMLVVKPAVLCARTRCVAPTSSVAPTPSRPRTHRRPPALRVTRGLAMYTTRAPTAVGAPSCAHKVGRGHLGLPVEAAVLGDTGDAAPR